MLKLNQLPTISFRTREIRTAEYHHPIKLIGIIIQTEARKKYLTDLILISNTP